MTRPAMFGVLHAARLAYERDIAKLAPLLVREGEIRRALAQLDAPTTDIEIDDHTMQQLQSFGGDIAWQAWKDRQRSNLNTRLARVLAERTRMNVQLRLSYGRYQAAQTLMNREIANQSARNTKRLGSELTDLISSRRT